MDFFLVFGVDVGFGVGVIILMGIGCVIWWE